MDTGATSSNNQAFDQNGTRTIGRTRTMTITTMHLLNMLNAAAIVFTGFDGMPDLVFGHISSAFIAAYLLVGYSKGHFL